MSHGMAAVLDVVRLSLQSTSSQCEWVSAHHSLQVNTTTAQYALSACLRLITTPLHSGQSKQGTLLVRYNHLQQNHRLAALLRHCIHASVGQGSKLWQGETICNREGKSVSSAGCSSSYSLQNAATPAQSTIHDRTVAPACFSVQ